MFTPKLGRIAFALLALGLLPSAVHAAQAPVMVSPGGETGGMVLSRCPTFSWSAAEGAVEYEIAVYRVGESALGASAPEESQLVVRRRLPAGATSWTPAVDECLDRGGTYAWSVRSIERAGSARWPEASVFRVSGSPSRAEVETAIEVLRQFLERNDDADIEALEELEPASGSPGGVPVAEGRGSEARGPEPSVPSSGQHSSSVEAILSYELFVNGGAYAAGDVITDSDFRYGSGKTHYKWIGSPQFVSDWVDADDFRRSTSGYLYPSGEDHFYVHAPVELPDGADITAVTCYYYDNDPNLGDDIEDFEFYLRSRSYTSTNDVLLAFAASTPTSGATDAIRSLSDTTVSTGGGAVENAVYAYHIYIYMDTKDGSICTFDCRFYGCRITYSLNELRPGG